MSDHLQPELDRLQARWRRKQKMVRDEVYAHPMAEETHQEVILDELYERPESDVPNRLHVGVAGLFNFEIASITRPSALLLLDYNEDQERFWKMIVTALKEGEDIGAFHDRFSLLLQEQLGQHDGIRIIHPRRFVDYLSHMEWLNDPELYQYFHELATHDKIMTATVDLAGPPEASRSIGDFITRHGFHVDTCYWSNIGQFFAPHLRGDIRADDGAVFADGELVYRQNYYDRTRCEGDQLWDGEEYRSDWLGHEKRVDFQKLPAFERFLRNISEIGGAHGFHMLTSNAPDMDTGLPIGLSFTRNEDGSVNIMLQGGGPDEEDKRLDMKPIFAEGPLRRTHEQWQDREDAKALHDKAAASGKPLY